MWLFTGVIMAENTACVDAEQSAMDSLAHLDKSADSPARPEVAELRSRDAKNQSEMCEASQPIITVTEACGEGQSRPDGIAGAVRELVAQFRELRQELEPSQHQDKRDLVLKDLHDQLQEARAGVHWKILRVVLTEIVKLHDELTRLKAVPPTVPEAYGQVIDSLRQDVEDILERQGFLRFSQNSGQFDGKRQQPVGIMETDDPGLVGAVAKRIASGFASEDRVLRPEKVVIYVSPKSSSAK
jgi:molecular chaperone GrpE (heat shock protein)